MKKDESLFIHNGLIEIYIYIYINSILTLEIGYWASDLVCNPGLFSPLKKNIQLYTLLYFFLWRRNRKLIKGE